MRNTNSPLISSAALHFAFITPFILYGIYVPQIPYVFIELFTSLYMVFWNVYEPEDDDTGLVYKYLINLCVCSELMYVSKSKPKVFGCIILNLIDLAFWIVLNPLDRYSDGFEINTSIWQIIHSTKSFIMAGVIAKTFP